MYRWVKTIWGSDPVEFPSSYDLAESVGRLKAVTKGWSLFGVSEQSAVGRVTGSGVSLRRVIPMVGNAFKPVFVGRFEQAHGKVTLVGRFRLSWIVRIFMAYWFGFCAVFVALSLAAARGNPSAAFMAVPGVGMFLLGLGMTRLFAWFSRNDPMWLSEVVRSALQVPPSTEDSGSPALVEPHHTRPWFILIATAVFCLFGVTCLVAAVQGVGTAGTHPGGSIAERYPYAIRVAAAVYGVLLLTCAYGIFRRHLFAWWAGFALLLLGQAYSMFDLLTRTDLGDAQAPTAVFCLVSVVVAAIWARWWYAQRIHFAR